MIKKSAFSLIEILVVLAIMGMLVAIVVPKFQNALDISKSQINKATMQDIKRAVLDFKRDVGFVADNVSLLVYPFESCNVESFQNDTNSSTCKNMIAFIDSRLTIDKYRINDSSVGDYGKNMRREQKLIDEIQKRLNSKSGGWRGSYIGGNAHLLSEQIKVLGDGSNENNNEYFVSKKDIDIYYNGYSSSSTIDFVGLDHNKLYPIKASDFNGARGSSGVVGVDALYDIAKYRDNLRGEITILDPWGTPYEIQFPSQSSIDAVYGIGKKTRERFARIISFGQNRQRDIEADKVVYDASSHDDSIVYIYNDHNLSDYFYVSDEF